MPKIGCMCHLLRVNVTHPSALVVLESKINPKKLVTLRWIEDDERGQSPILFRGASFKTPR